MKSFKKAFASVLRRRQFINMGTSSAMAMVISRSVGGATTGEHDDEDSLHTRLCDILGIQFPLVQAGMGGVAGPELAAIVSESGGLGIVAGTFQPADELRRRIRKVKELTRKPFAVNLMLHEDMINPKDIAGIPQSQVQEVQKILNGFREQLGIPLQNTLSIPVPDLLAEQFEIILEEKVPIWSIGLGKPSADQVRRCKEKGVKIVAMISTVEDAKELSATGVDVIVAQGSEAGGHRSTWLKRSSKEEACIGTLALVPQVVDAVQQPVIAAGSISDGRGMAAALALGASGVLIGTRFIATKESMASDLHKQAILKASSDHTIVTDKFSGAYARVIRNSYTDQYERAGGKVLPPWVHLLAARDINRAAIEKNKPEFYSLWAGQGVGQIRNIPGADEVVRSIIKQARDTIQKLPSFIKK